MDADHVEQTFLELVADQRCELVSISDAAEQIGRSETFVRCVLAHDLTPRFVGRVPLFRQRDVDNWMLDHARMERRPRS